MNTKQDKLFTSSYIFSCIANFLLYLGFYLVMPILALYLLDTFHIQKSTVGTILSSYTIAALLIRPFSGFLLDAFARKPLYLFSLLIFLLIFAGYPLATSIALFTIFRFLHGLAFGTVSVAGNTIVIDIMPSSRRGEGLGYYGVANNIAMAVGPMLGMFLLEHYSYNVVFYTALFTGVLAFIFGTMIQSPAKPSIIGEPISLDRFILKKGIPVGLNLILISAPYGMIAVYIALYAYEIGITQKIGYFYMLMAIGLILSRLLSGKQVDKGKITQVIIMGMTVAASAFFLLGATAYIIQYNTILGYITFFFAALTVGFGYGSIAPAMNNIFVNLAPNNKRGTANSTYLTSWDLGIGIGLTLGGYIAEHINLSNAYFIGCLFALIGVAQFKYYSAPYYNRNKLR